MSEPAADDDVPGWLAVALAVGLVLLLSVWTAFLVPLRVGDVPVPLWLVPLAGMLLLAREAARTAGLPGVLLPAAVWVGVSWPVLGRVRAEGDLVVPATTAGYLYLMGGLLLWVAVVVTAPGRGTPPAAPPPAARRPAATPAPRQRR